MNKEIKKKRTQGCDDKIAIKRENVGVSSYTLS